MHRDNFQKLQSWCIILPTQDKEEVLEEMVLHLQGIICHKEFFPVLLVPQ